MKSPHVVLGILAMPFLFCQGISRVGTGSLSQIEFSAPRSMPAVRPLPEGGVSFSGFATPFQGLQFIEIRQLKKEFPDVDEPSSFVKRLEKSGYKEQKSALDCGFRVSKDNGSTIVEVMSWGPEDGIVIIGKSHPFSRAAMKQLIKSLKLKEGACK